MSLEISPSSLASSATSASSSAQSGRPVQISDSTSEPCSTGGASSPSPSVGPRPDSTRLVLVIPRTQCRRAPSRTSSDAARNRLFAVDCDR